MSTRVLDKTETIVIGAASKELIPIDGLSEFKSYDLQIRNTGAADAFICNREGTGAETALLIATDSTVGLTNVELEDIPAVYSTTGTTVVISYLETSE